MFGGTDNACYMMCALNKEGEFEEDLSGNGLIPGCMCEGQFVVEEEKLGKSRFRIFSPQTKHTNLHHPVNYANLSV